MLRYLLITSFFPMMAMADSSVTVAPDQTIEAKNAVTANVKFTIHIPETLQIDVKTLNGNSRVSTDSNIPGKRVSNQQGNIVVAVP